MPCGPLLRFSDCPADTPRAEAGELMAGLLDVTCGAATAPQPAFVRIYRTSSEHFAVLYPARAIVAACRPFASVNLRSCCVKPLPGGAICVSPRSGDGSPVVLRGAAADRMDAWAAALADAPFPARKKVSAARNRQPLPVVVESEEEDGAVD